MMNVIFTRLDQIDWDSTHAQVTVLDHVDQLSQHEEGTFLLEPESLTPTSNQQVFIPLHELPKDAQEQSSLFTYVDLESYPFFQQAKKVIESEKQREGVFRFRRTVKESTGLDLLAGDLYVLADLFGEPESISVKKTDSAKLPAHVIVLVNFGEGTMAHIEYTVTDHERIELEWSGMEHIIEFDSDEMSPFQPADYTSLPLMYSVDSIMQTARKVDEDLIKQIKSLNDTINGGDQL